MRFVTLFPKSNTDAITKDTVQTPASMARFYGYDGRFVTYKNGDYEIQKKKYAPEVTIQYLKRLGKHTELLDELIYICRHAAEIDLLHMFHMNIGHLICLNIFKILNPRGITYLRLDIDYPALSSHNRLSKWKKAIIRFLHKGVDIISAESDITCKIYKNIFGIKPVYIPACYIDVDSIKDEKYSTVQENTMDSCKEKIIMTAGRLGTKQKATEVLLEAFAKTKRTDEWRLILAGSRTESLEKWLQDFYARFPDIYNKIEFTGNITDKKELYNLMKKASIFAMPSRWGGSEIATVEALVQGDYLLLSDQIPPYEEYTDHGRFGKKISVDDIQAWSDAIDDAVEIIENGYNFIEQYEYGKKTFSWRRISAILNDCINEQLANS